jgi:3-methyladenine DNA glycosylase/8-oxoguanine DNA glycosylase
MRVRAGIVERLLVIDGERVLVRAAQPKRELVVFVARAGTRAVAELAVTRLRLALGVDHDLRPFYERFRFDPLIGRSVRSDPGYRVIGRPNPFEALAWAICEQLIELERAASIQRRLAFALAGRCPATGLLAAPEAPAVARAAPARLESLGLSASRAIALRRAAREVTAGRIDLEAPDHERSWRRLRAVPGIGRWTVQMLALTGQGRLDQLPAGDLAYLKLVGRLQSGDPYARATEEEVCGFFERYDPWAGLAGAHALRAFSRGAVSAPVPATPRATGGRSVPSRHAL